jgi:hypothetical protein
MDELKNLVIQTLETNGILGQIRAKLRSSVFKVIDNNDPSGKERALHWENPLAQQVLETTESALASDLIREYLEFYRLDYTLSIFIPEANLKQDPLDKGNLVSRAEVDAPNEKEPLLVQVLKQRKSGGGPSARSAVSRPEVSKPAPSRSPVTKSPAASKSPAPSKSPAASKSPVQNENTNFGSSNQGLVKKLKEEPKPETSGSKYTNKQPDLNDYVDDFEDDIEESLDEDNDDRQADDDVDKMFTESGNAFTGSQSMGMDPSVNTLAMDEYDHVEEVMHLT